MQVWGSQSATAACGGGCGGGCGGPPKPNVTDDGMCAMAMYFNANKNVCVWLAAWHVTNAGQYAAAVIGILVCARVCCALCCGLRQPWLIVFCVGLLCGCAGNVCAARVDDRVPPEAPPAEVCLFVVMIADPCLLS